MICFALIVSSKSAAAAADSRDLHRSLVAHAHVALQVIRLTDAALCLADQCKSQKYASARNSYARQWLQNVHDGSASPLRFAYVELAALIGVNRANMLTDALRTTEDVHALVADLCACTVQTATALVAAPAQSVLTDCAQLHAGAGAHVARYMCRVLQTPYAPTSSTLAQLAIENASFSSSSSSSSSSGLLPNSHVVRIRGALAALKEFGERVVYRNSRVCCRSC
jgi:hypothetical protein